jgi:hypothetical protein
MAFRGKLMIGSGEIQQKRCESLVGLGESRMVFSELAMSLEKERQIYMGSVLICR